MKNYGFKVGDKVTLKKMPTVIKTLSYNTIYTVLAPLGPYGARINLVNDKGVTQSYYAGSFMLVNPEQYD